MSDPGASTGMETNVFISYSRRDLAFVDRLALALASHGIAPAIDRAEIYAFEDWWKRIEALIGAADTVIFVLSPDAIASDICRREVECAQRLAKRFAPIVCRSVAAEMDRIPPALADLNFIFFDTPQSFDAAIETLVEALTTDIGWVRLHTEYGLDAAEWARATRPSGLLLRSPRLEAAERWIATRPPGAPAPADVTQAFILASRQGATRRRKLVTGGLAAGLVVALGLAGVALWQRGEAIAQRQAAERQRQTAERNFAAAKAAVDGLIFDIVQGFENVAGLRQETVRKVLETVEQNMDKLIATAPDDIGLQRSRATMLNNWVTIYRKSGARGDALAAADKSLSVFAELAERQPQTLGPALDAVLALNARAEIKHQLGQKSGAIADYLEAQRRELVLWPRHSDETILAELTISTLNGLGDIERDAGHYADAIRLYETSVLQARRLATRNLGRPDRQRAIALCLSNLAAAKEQSGDLAGAAALLPEIIDAARRRAGTGPDDLQAQRDLTVELEKLAVAKRSAGDKTASVAAEEDAVSIARRIVRLDPRNQEAKRDLAAILRNLGTLKLGNADRSGAVAAFKESVSLLEPLAERDRGNPVSQQDLASAYSKLSQGKLTAGDAAGALAAALDGYAITQRLAAGNPKDSRLQQDLAGALLDRGLAHLLLKDKAAALHDFRDSLAVLRDISRKDERDRQARRDLYNFHVEIGSTLLEQGFRDDALHFYREGREVAEDLAGSDPADAKAEQDLSFVRGRVAELEQRVGRAGADEHK